MIATDIDFAAARKHMVDSQVRPNKVTNPRLIAALRSVERERFLPADRSALAYADEDVPLGGGRVLMEPMVLARLLQAAAPMPGEKALVIGAGTGYGAAVLAACGLTVFAVEEDAALLAIGRAAVPAEVSLVSGPIEAGWAGRAPYDLILVEGAVDAFPAAFGAQLVPLTGRLVGVRRTGTTSQAVIGESVGGQLSVLPLFECATPLFPTFRRAPGFVF